MNYPKQFGLPQLIILIAVLIAGVLIFTFFTGLAPRKQKLEDKYGNIHYRRRPRKFRWQNIAGSIALLIIAGFIFWIASAAQEYLALTGKILVAHVRATPAKIPNSNIPMLSVDLTLYDQNGNPTSENTYVLNGDEVYIGGDIIQYQSWLNILGFHSGYKVTRLEGMYSDVNLEEHAQHTVQVLNGGDDAYFNMAYHQGLNSFTVTAAYKNGSTVPTNGIGYNICASQDAVVPQPDNQSC